MEARTSTLSSTAVERPQRPSLLRPLMLSPDEQHWIPLPPSITERPKDASEKNIELMMDAKEAQALELEKELISTGRASVARGNKKRASILTKFDVEDGVVVPAPPEEPRPASADEFNYIAEVTLREKMLRERGATGTALPEDGEEEEVVFPLPKHAFETVLQNHTKMKLFEGLSADRIATQMEDVIFTGDSVKRAVAWIPADGDIIVASAPRCGQSIVVLMVRLLCAESKQEFNEILAVPSRTPPWIECALTDEEPRVLDRLQPGSNRIFRTTMTHTMLSVKSEKCPGAKFIAVFRNPLDLRIAWFDHLKMFYAKHQHALKPDMSEEQWRQYFDKNYVPDDIANTPLTMVQNTFHSSDHTKEYEFNVRDWVAAAEAKPHNTLVVFLEEILSAPERALQKIAKFIGRDTIDEDVFDRILEETTGPNLIKISRRNSQMLTPDQEALIRVKFAIEEPSERDLTSATAGPDVGDKRLNLLRQLESGQNISSRGIFTEISRKMDPKSARRSELTADLAISTQVDLSPRAIELLRQRWADTFGSRALTYEDLYESIVKDKYPALRTTVVPSRKTGVGAAAFSTNGGNGAGPRRTVLSRIFKTSSDDGGVRKSNNESDGSEETPAKANRRTIKLKLFGKKDSTPNE